MPNTRRHLLRAALGLAAVPAVVPTASALRIEDMDAPRQRLIVTACEARNEHRRQIDAMIADLEGRGLAQDQAREVVLASDCPFCGCTLGLAAFGDLPETPQPPKF
jgi:hypothetical protein